MARTKTPEPAAPNPFDLLKERPDWQALSGQPVFPMLVRLSASDPVSGAVLLAETAAQFGVEAERTRFMQDRTLGDLLRIWTPARRNRVTSAERVEASVAALSALLDNAASPAAKVQPSVPAVRDPIGHTPEEKALISAIKEDVGNISAKLLYQRILDTGHVEYAPYLTALADFSRIAYNDRIRDMSHGFIHGQTNRVAELRQVGKALVSTLTNDLLAGAKSVIASELPSLPPALVEVERRWQRELEQLKRSVGFVMPSPAMLERTTVTVDASRGRMVVDCQHPLGCVARTNCFEAVFDIDGPTVKRPATPCTPADRSPSLMHRHCGNLGVGLVAALATLRANSPEGEALREVLVQPAHTRFMREFGRAADVAMVASPALEKSDRSEVLGWLVDTDRAPQLAWLKPRKKGDGFTWSRTGLADRNALSFLTDPMDMVAYKMSQDASKSATYLSELVPLLLPLIGRPNVYRRIDRTAVPAQVLLASPTVTFEPIPGSDGLKPVVRFAPGTADNLRATLPPTPGEPIITIFEPEDKNEKTRIYVGFWSADAVRTCTPVIRHAYNPQVQTPLVVPMEMRAELVDAAISLAEHGPVQLERAWLGDGEPAPLRLVIRLGFHRVGEGRVLRAEIRVHPSDALGPLRPGEGPEIIPFERDGSHGFITRDFSAEIDAVAALGAELETELALPPEALPFTYEVADLDHAIPLIRHLDVLRASGFRTIPVTLVWETKVPKATRTPNMSDLKLKIRGKRRDWLNAEGGLKLDGSELPLAELLEALRDGKRFVELKGDRFVELDEALRKQLEPLRAMLRANAKGIGTHALALPLAESLRDGGAEIDVPPDWQLRSDRLKESAGLPVAVPAELVATLRPYQHDGFAWLVRLAHWSTGAVLADDMGLGKTVQAIAFLLARRAEGAVLIVAPTSVVPNWRRELERFAPDLVVRVAQSGAALAGDGMRGADVLVTSYDVLARNESVFVEKSWPTVVLDEAHAVKNSQTRRAQAVRALEAGFVLALTGTPVENRPRELWSLFRVVTPGLLGSEEDFQASFGRAIEFDRNPNASAALAALVRPFILRRTKGEVASDLPPRTEIRVDVVFEAAERNHYDKLRKAALADLAKKGTDPTTGKRNAIQILAVITRLRQLACHGHLVDPLKVPPTREASAKLERLVELVSELVSENKQILVFSQFTEFLGLASMALSEAGIAHIQLDGSTPATKRSALIDRFQNHEVPVFLLSLKAGGVGLNLTAASEVIILDPWWNPAVEDQAADRAHRIGQDKNVTIYRLVAEGTIEDQILGLHGDKRAMVSSLLDGTAQSASLGIEEIESLLLAGLDG